MSDKGNQKGLTNTLSNVHQRLRVFTRPTLDPMACGTVVKVSMAKQGAKRSPDLTEACTTSSARPFGNGMQIRALLTLLFVPLYIDRRLPEGEGGEVGQHTNVNLSDF